MVMLLNECFYLLVIFIFFASSSLLCDIFMQFLFCLKLSILLDLLLSFLLPDTLLMMQDHSAHVVNALSFILPSIISHNKTSFLSMCPSHLCCHCQIIFNMLLSSFTFSRTEHICYFVLPSDV